MSVVPSAVSTACRLSCVVHTLSYVPFVESETQSEDSEDAVRSTREVKRQPPGKCKFTHYLTDCIICCMLEVHG